MSQQPPHYTSPQQYQQVPPQPPKQYAPTWKHRQYAFAALLLYSIALIFVLLAWQDFNNVLALEGAIHDTLIAIGCIALAGFCTVMAILLHR